jgi:hypothetical protein
MLEPDAWSMPSPRNNLPVKDVPVDTHTLSKERFKAPALLRSQKGVQLEHEIRTIQAEIQAFSEMMACRLNCERADYIALNKKVHSLSGNLNSSRLTTATSRQSAPVVASKPENGHQLWHTHHSQLCGLCGVWYTSGEGHACVAMKMDGDLEEDPLMTSMQNYTTDDLGQLVEEQVCILTSRKHEKSKQRDVKTAASPPAHISRPRAQEARDMEHELHELVANMNRLEGDNLTQGTV